jgi:hypothetical protein
MPPPTNYEYRNLLFLNPPLPITRSESSSGAMPGLTASANGAGFLALGAQSNRVTPAAAEARGINFERL